LQNIEKNALCKKCSKKLFVRKLKQIAKALYLFFMRKIILLFSLYERINMSEFHERKAAMSGMAFLLQQMRSTPTETVAIKEVCEID
jgi:hypothetical protein